MEDTEVQKKLSGSVHMRVLFRRITNIVDEHQNGGHWLNKECSDSAQRPVEEIKNKSCP